MINQRDRVVESAYGIDSLALKSLSPSEAEGEREPPGPIVSVMRFECSFKWQYSTQNMHPQHPPTD